MPKFKLLAGKHEDERGNKYVVGDVVESKVDLVNYFGAEKFVQVDDRVISKFQRPQTKEEELLQKQIDDLQAKLHLSRQQDGNQTTVPAQPQTSTNGENSPPPKGIKPKNPNDVTLNFEAMNPKELNAFAEEREIDLKGETRKNEIIKILKAAVAG